MNANDTKLYSAKLRGVRIAPRKVRLVADLVRGKLVSDAMDMLKVMNKRSAPVVSKLLASAVAGAKEKATVDIDRLYIHTVFVDSGPTMKRWCPRAQGRATPIMKRSSHVTVKLSEL
jgi:large subunit ribosomal protein L22